MNLSDYDADDITLEMELQYIERLPVIESQDLRRFKQIANPSYHLTTMKKKFMEDDHFLKLLQQLNKTCHKIEAWIQKKRKPKT